MRNIRLLLLFVLILRFSSATPDSPENYDGIWWQHTAPQERLGFIDGYGDCYTYDVQKGRNLTQARSWYAKAISEYYDTHPSDSMLPAGKALVLVTPEASRNAKAPSRVPKHGELDGMVWLNYSKEERLGFVEGYLSCRLPLQAGSAQFSKHAQYYADAITTAYGVDKLEQGVIEALDDRAGRKIAEVLWSLRDSSESGRKRQ